jgi:hypothetical protein
MSSHRKGVQLFLAKVLLRNKAKGVKTSFDLSLLMAIQKYHRYFGIGALLTAVIHAAVQFSVTGAPSLTGGTMVGLLVAQGVTGYLQEKGKGNRQVAKAIHEFVPFLLFALIILHIIFNTQSIGSFGVFG